jgi:ABC-type dipeptide/oligopeptide/nickel transport system permease component
MVRYLGRRLVSAAVTVAGVVLVVFFVVRVIPGDSAALRAGPNADPSQIQAIRDRYGLDDPLWQQFRTYLSKVVQGDFGTSMRTDGSVTTELLARLPASLELALYGLAFAAVLGFVLGLSGAALRGTAWDAVVRVIAVIGSSVAIFWLGLLAIYVFYYRLSWFPAPIDRIPLSATPPPTVTGLITFDALLAGNPVLAGEAFSQIALPALTLGFVLAAPITKMVRTSVIESLSKDYVRTARSVGIPFRTILFKDGLRNAMLPIVTTVGIVFGYMIGGNVIIESLFSWPGVGQYAYKAISAHDLDALHGFVIVIGLLYVTLNLLIDLSYLLIDPRVRLGGREA